MPCYVVVILHLHVRIASDSALYHQCPLLYVEATTTLRFALPVTSISSSSKAGLQQHTVQSQHCQCAAHCRRLAQHYQLQLVSAKTILAAADELGGSTKQVGGPCQLYASPSRVCAVCTGSQLDALVNLVVCIAQWMKATTDLPRQMYLAKLMQTGRSGCHSHHVPLLLARLELPA